MGREKKEEKKQPLIYRRAYLAAGFVSSHDDSLLRGLGTISGKLYGLALPPDSDRGSYNCALGETILGSKSSSDIHHHHASAGLW